MKHLSLILSTFLFLIFITVSGCGKDENDNNCSNFQSIGGQVSINGSDYKLSVAQLIISGGFGTTYQMQIGAFSSDCNELNSISIIIEEGVNEKLNGSYDIVDFFNSEENKAFGSFANQKISPISQSSVDLSGGSVKFIDLGSKKYNIDLNATLLGGGNVTLKGDVQF